MVQHAVLVITFGRVTMATVDKTIFEAFTVAVQQACLTTCLDGLCDMPNSLKPRCVLHRGLLECVVCLRLRRLGGKAVHVRCRCHVFWVDGRYVCCLRLISSHQHHSKKRWLFVAACCIVRASGPAMWLVQVLGFDARRLRIDGEDGPRAGQVE